MPRILHVDMDAFYASVEQRDHPEYRGKPVVVGGSPFSRGVVSAASYEARRHGIHSAMPLRRAYDLCPDAVFLPVDMERYAQVSRQLHDVLRRFSPLVEPLSLDEAFLEVTGGDAVAAGRAIKAAVREELGLTASVGVSVNKFLAKMASDLEKPDGFTVLMPRDVARLIHPLPVRKLWGIGPRSEIQLKSLGILTIGDILKVDLAVLERRFGRRAAELRLLAQGIDHSRVETEHEARSLGEETTFPRDVADRAVVAGHLDRFAGLLADRLRRRRLRARTVTVKVRYADFQTLTRSHTLETPVDDAADLARTARALWARVATDRKVRLVGLQVSGLVPADRPEQLRFPFW